MAFSSISTLAGYGNQVAAGQTPVSALAKIPMAPGLKSPGTLNPTPAPSLSPTAGYNPATGGWGAPPARLQDAWLPISGGYTSPGSGQYLQESQEYGQQNADANTTRMNTAAAEARKQQAFEAQQQALSGLTSALTAGVSGGGGGYIGGGGGYAPPMSVGTTSPTQYATVSMSPVGGVPDASAAQNAAFGSAKAKAGSLGRSAVNSLRADLAERGIMGGGTEARGLTDRLAAATNPLSDLNVAQQNEKLGIIQHNQDLGANQAATEFQGNVSQRGQNIQNDQASAARSQQANQFNASRAQQASKFAATQAAQAEAQQMQMLQAALSGLSRVY